MQKWEYLVLHVMMTPEIQFAMKLGEETFTGKRVWEHMNTLGRDGWELVAVAEIVGNERSAQSNLDKGFAMVGARMMGDTTLTVTQHRPVTLGYLYHFKRERANSAAEAN